ncbi:short chain dehydrogenase domain-containing protein [Sarocladium implicatum]|jgi:NAD(P)-dependent dehydrogenase (short-subunit alcohol dehydrogenase family)|nr:short chain dehydrogenase domain-containing protein [Sarocladium implicatum]
MTTSRPVVLVTGANQGIGFATVKLLAKTNQYNVILTSRDANKGKAARQEILDSESVESECLHAVQLDVQNDESILAAAELIKTDFGVVDILINNAGKTAIAGESVSENRAKWLDCLDLNVVSAAMVTDVFAPLLKKSTYSKRRVIFVSTSISSITLNNEPEGANYKQAPYPIYKSSKTALNMLAQCYSRGEFLDTGVAVVLACPGFAKTAFAGYIGYMAPEESAAIIVSRLDGDNDQVDGKFFLSDNSLSPW